MENRLTNLTGIFGRLPLRYLSVLLLGFLTVGSLSSCNDFDKKSVSWPDGWTDPEDPEETPYDKESDYYEFIDLLTANANDMNVTKEGEAYVIETTGGDPYMYSKGLEGDLPPANVWFTFDYIAEEGFGDMQIYMMAAGVGIAEPNSVSGFMIPPASEWTRISFDFTEIIERLGFGEAQSSFRFDPLQDRWCQHADTQNPFQDYDVATDPDRYYRD